MRVLEIFQWIISGLPSPSNPSDVNGHPVVNNDNKGSLQENHTIATSNQTLKNCKLANILAHLQANKLSCHSFMDFGKQQKSS